MLAVRGSVSAYSFMLVSFLDRVSPSGGPVRTELPPPTHNQNETIRLCGEELGNEVNLSRPWVFCAVNSSEPIPDIRYETFSFMMSLLAKSF